MKRLLRQQYRDEANRALDHRDLHTPREGWVRTVRKALGMSAEKLGLRMGLSRYTVAQMERLEVEGRVTLRQLARAAAALDCKVVYALVPAAPVEELLSQQARRKARHLVEEVSRSMALEQQQLTESELENRIQERAREYLDNPPKDLWVDDDVDD